MWTVLRPCLKAKNTGSDYYKMSKAPELVTGVKNMTGSLSLWKLLMLCLLVGSWADAQEALSVSSKEGRAHAPNEQSTEAHGAVILW